MLIYQVWQTPSPMSIACSVSPGFFLFAFCVLVGLSVFFDLSHFGFLLFLFLTRSYIVRSLSFIRSKTSSFAAGLYLSVLGKTEDHHCPAVPLSILSFYSVVVARSVPVHVGSYHSLQGSS